MGWDRSARPRRIRRKQKRIVLLVAIVGSFTLVSIMGLWNNILSNSEGSIIGFVSDFFTDEEKKVVWDGMSDEGKAIILKHAPDVK